MIFFRPQGRTVGSAQGYFSVLGVWLWLALLRLGVTVSVKRVMVRLRLQLRVRIRVSVIRPMTHDQQKLANFCWSCVIVISLTTGP